MYTNRFHSIDGAVNESTKLINNGELVVLPVGIGPNRSVPVEVVATVVFDKAIVLNPDIICIY